jgi:hypothetical protein
MSAGTYTPHPLRVRREHMRAPLDGAVLVARPSRWANPFWPPPGGQSWTRAEAVEMYEDWLLDNVPDDRGDIDALVRDITALRGKRLACYCALDEPCHADVLARLANGEEVAS